MRVRVGNGVANGVRVRVRGADTNGEQDKLVGREAVELLVRVRVRVRVGVRVRVRVRNGVRHRVRVRVRERLTWKYMPADSVAQKI